jgi:Lon protease-like protein
MDRCMDLPLFPLHTVLCPGIALPLHIFEPRYRLMVQRCLEDDVPFGVVWIRDGREVGSGSLAVASIGTMAEIREADRLADGRYELISIGTRRFRLEEAFTDREPYLVGRIEPIEEVVVDEERAAQLARLVTRRFVRYVDQVRELAAGDGPDEPDEEDEVAVGEAQPVDADPGGAGHEGAEGRASLAIPADPTLLSHLLSGIVELDLPRRQALLEAPTTESRLGSLATVLAREVAYLRQSLRVFTPDPRLQAARRN